MVMMMLFGILGMIALCAAIYGLVSVFIENFFSL